MKIDSRDKKIKDVFKGREYIIPDYQRDYSWDIKEEVGIFWDDFLYYLGNESMDNFFLGAFIFKGNNGVDSTKLEVIDGQQRLITISIFINVLVSFFEECKAVKKAAGLKEFLVFRDVDSEDRVVVNTEDPHPFYQKLIFHFEESRKPTKTSEKLILRARNFFIEKMRVELKSLKAKEKIEKLVKIRDYLLGIDVVIIVSDNQYDAYTIFETINTRGKSLSSMDLLKNYIFKTYPKQAGVMEHKKIWKEIKNNLKGKEADKFFNRFWASHVMKIPENKLYRRFYDYMRTSHAKFNNSKQLLQNLNNSAVIYKKVLAPNLDDWKHNKNFRVYFALKHMVGHFNVKVIIPFLLALVEEFENKKIKKPVFINTLISLENFHFIFSHIVSSRPSGMDIKYSKFAIKLRNEVDKEAVITELLKELKIKLPSSDEYTEKFVALNYNKNKDTIKYILVRLEKETDSKIVLDLEDHSLDHLYPKSKKLANVHNIGNLFLLERVLNEEKQDYMLFDKKDKADKMLIIDNICNETKYNNTQIELQEIREIGLFDRSDIKKRARKLAKSTYKVFSKI